MRQRASRIGVSSNVGRGGQIPHVREAWMIKSADPVVRKGADAYFAKLDAVAERQAKAFQDGVPGAQVVRLTGMHYVYVSNEFDVLRLMRAFLDNLRR